MDGQVKICPDCGEVNRPVDPYKNVDRGIWDRGECPNWTYDKMDQRRRTVCGQPLTLPEPVQVKVCMVHGEVERPGIACEIARGMWDRSRCPVWTEAKRRCNKPLTPKPEPATPEDISFPDEAEQYAADQERRYTEEMAEEPHPFLGLVNEKVLVTQTLQAHWHCPICKTKLYTSSSDIQELGKTIRSMIIEHSWKEHAGLMAGYLFNHLQGFDPVLEDSE